MHELLKKLMDQRARAFEAMKAMIDRAGDDDTQWSAEDQQEFERIGTDLDGLDERIGQLSDRIERENKATGERARVERIIRPEEPVRGDTETLDDRVLAWARGQGSKAIEVPLTGLRVSRDSGGAWEVRDLTVGSAAAGGDTVPESFRRSLYEHLIENSAIRQTRAEIITTASGEDLILPKTTAHPAAGTIVSEGAAIGESDPTFGQGTLQAFKYAELIQVSTELITDTGVDLLGYLARAFGRALGNGSGADFVTGSGSSKPRGVITAGSLMVTGGTGVSGEATGDNLIDLFFTVKEPYAVNGEWLLRRATLGKVRKLKDANNQYLWQPGLAGDVQSTILGAPYVLDPNVPAAGTAATSIAFGDFSAYKIRDVGSLRFERSDDFAFNADLVTFRAILRTDGDLLDETGAIGTYKGGSS
jgi:HK97 family phage major capsid protein